MLFGLVSARLLVVCMSKNYIAGERIDVGGSKFDRTVMAKQKRCTSDTGMLEHLGLAPGTVPPLAPSPGFSSNSDRGFNYGILVWISYDRDDSRGMHGCTGNLGICWLLRVV